jgi:hypothetical protein
MKNLPLYCLSIIMKLKVYLCALAQCHEDLYGVYTHVEAGSNTSTVTLRVVRGDEMGLKKAAP